MITPAQISAIQSSLKELQLDGWLLYDFRAVNPVTGRVLGVGGMGSRRLFVVVPREGRAVAVAHKIELQPVNGFPGDIRPYAKWEELHRELGNIVKGKRLAMEVSPEDAVPYLDRVPAGVVELVRKLGGTVVPSAPLVSRFAASWSASETADHLYASEVLAEVANAELRWAVARGQGIRETELQARVVDGLHKAGLEFDHPPIVAFGANAANPHYEPVKGSDALLEKNQVVLLDLWAGRGLATVFADQTWMGVRGGRPSEKVQRGWGAVRDGGAAAIDLVLAAAGKRPVSGFEADRAARSVIEKAGWGEYFVHRTGHSIDRDLHGSGPHLDDYETHDDRQLIQGVGFSIEPGIYLPGEFGVRSEVNMFWGAEGPRVTPQTPQRDLIVA